MNAVVDSQAKSRGQIWEVLISNIDPLARPTNHDRPTVEEIASATDVTPSTVERHLKSFNADDKVFSITIDGDLIYYPDPVRAYLDRLEEFIEPHDVSMPAIDKDAIREDITHWKNPSNIESIEDVYEYRMGSQLILGSRTPVGFQPYEHDWDVLVILDACRFDALRSIVERIDGVEQMGVAPCLSLGSQTAEWLCHMFTTDHLDEIGRTGYVAGNGWVKGIFNDGLRPEDVSLNDGRMPPTSWSVVDGKAFGAIVHAWRQDKHEYSDSVPWGPHPSPRTVTDHAIALARDRPDLKRLIVHYKQPHFPYTISAKSDGRTELEEFERAPFEYLASGGQTKTVWNAYLTDLRAAADEISILCRNIDGTIAITADHGENFDGERHYLHRPTMLHPKVKRVPWATISATDKLTHKGDLSSYHTVDRKVEEQLKALGYRYDI